MLPGLSIATPLRISENTRWVWLNKSTSTCFSGGVHRRQQAFFHMKCVAVAKQNPLVFHKQQFSRRIESGQVAIARHLIQGDCWE